LSGDEVPIYTSGYEKLFTDSADWFAFVVLTILCINSFTVEYTKNSSCEGCASIIRATKKGRRHTFLAKTVTLGLIGSITTVLFRIVDTVVISEKYILTNTDAALYTIQSFGGITSMITIEQYFLIDLLIRLIGGMALAVLICVFSYLGKRILPALCLITVIMLIPEIIVLTVFNTLPEISLLSLTCLQRLPFSYSAGGYFADINTAYLWVGIVIVLILSVTLLAYRNYVGKRAFRKE